jgi:hypothetical protein
LPSGLARNPRPKPLPARDFHNSLSLYYSPASLHAMHGREMYQGPCGFGRE